MKNNLSNFNFGLALSDHKNKDRFTNKYYENSLDENYPIKNFNEVSVNSSNPNLSRNGHRQRMREHISSAEWKMHLTTICLNYFYQ